MAVARIVVVVRMAVAAARTAAVRIEAVEIVRTVAGPVACHSLPSTAVPSKDQIDYRIRRNSLVAWWTRPWLLGWTSLFPFFVPSVRIVQVQCESEMTEDIFIHPNKKNQQIYVHCHS